MRNMFVLFGIALFLLAGMTSLLAADKPAKGEAVTKSGVIEVKKAEGQEKYNTVTLKVAEEIFKLLPGKDKKVMAELEKLVGKTVEVMGELMPANPPKYPLAAIKVDTFKEAAAAAPAAAPAPAAVPAPAGQ